MRAEALQIGGLVQIPWRANIASCGRGPPLAAQRATRPVALADILAAASVDTTTCECPDDTPFALLLSAPPTRVQPAVVDASPTQSCFWTFT
jgi:hypothetical protein